jgi:hypothetical protein
MTVTLGVDASQDKPISVQRPNGETDPRHIPLAASRALSDRCKPYGAADVTTPAVSVVPSFLLMMPESQSLKIF